MITLASFLVFQEKSIISLIKFGGNNYGNPETKNA